jgi:TRAP-type uncharacterized transport system fused permease subunit
MLANIKKHILGIPDEETIWSELRKMAFFLLSLVLLLYRLLYFT